MNKRKVELEGKYNGFQSGTEDINSQKLEDILVNSNLENKIHKFYEKFGFVEVKHRRQLIHLIVENCINHCIHLNTEDFRQIMYDYITIFPKERHTMGPIFSSELAHQYRLAIQNEKHLSKRSHVEQQQPKQTFNRHVRTTKPSQLASETRIATLEKELSNLYIFWNTAELMDKQEFEKSILRIRKELQKERQILRRKRQNANYQKKHRDSKKAKLVQICNENPEISRRFKFRHYPSTVIDENL